MSAGPALLGVLLLAALAGAAQPARQAPRASAVQVPEGFEVLDALAADVDGAGGIDVVVARVRVEDGRRSLAVHLARDGRYAPEPDRALDLPPDVVAFLVADVHADPGAELVLLNARGAFAWRGAPDAKPPLVRLFATDFLWQIPDGRELFGWPSAARDLDGDGRLDLCLPEPDGYRVGLQRPSGEGVRFEDVRLAVPEQGDSSMLVERAAGGRRGEARARRRGREVAVGFDDEGLTFEESLGPLLSIFESTPTPGLVDWDADGDLDLVAYTTREVAVWRQDPGFAQAPSLRLTAPVVRDVGRQLDVSFSAHAVELDGDGRADCVVFAGDKRSDDVRTQALVFTRGPEPEEDPLFGADGVPQQVLVLAGFVASPRFVDVDLDGAVDLVVSVVRPDLIDAVRAASTERLDVQLYVYRNQGGRFSKRPDLDHKLSFAADSSEYAIRFVADVDGNGLRDLCVRDVDDEGEGELRLYRVRAERERLAVVGRPLWQLSVDAASRIRFPELRQAGADAVPGGEVVLALEEEQVLCVRWR